MSKGRSCLWKIYCKYPFISKDEKMGKYTHIIVEFNRVSDKSWYFFKDDEHMCCCQYLF